MRRMVRTVSHVTHTWISHVTHVQRSHITHTRILQDTPCKLPQALQRDHVVWCVGWSGRWVTSHTHEQVLSHTYKGVTSQTHKSCKMHLANFLGHFDRIMLYDPQDREGGESRYTHTNESRHTHTMESRHRHTNLATRTLQTSSGTSTRSFCVMRRMVRAVRNWMVLGSSKMRFILRSTYVSFSSLKNESGMAGSWFATTLCLCARFNKIEMHLWKEPPHVCTIWKYICEKSLIIGDGGRAADSPLHVPKYISEKEP